MSSPAPLGPFAYWLYMLGGACYALACVWAWRLLSQEGPKLTADDARAALRDFGYFFFWNGATVVMALVNIVTGTRLDLEPVVGVMRFVLTVLLLRAVVTSARYVRLLRDTRLHAERVVERMKSAAENRDAP